MDIDVGLEYDAPMFVDFAKVESYLNDDADMWFDKQETPFEDNFGEDSFAAIRISEVEAPRSEIAEATPMEEVMEEEEKDTPVEAMAVPSVQSKSPCTTNRRSNRLAAIIAKQMENESKKPASKAPATKPVAAKPVVSKPATSKPSAALSKPATAPGLKPFAALVAASKPATAPTPKALTALVAASKPATAPAPKPVAASKPAIAPQVTSSCKKPPTPDLKPKPFSFELDKRPGLRSHARTNETRTTEHIPMAEFIAKYQTATPPRFRRTPANQKAPATERKPSADYSLGTSITVPKTPTLLTRARARPVTQKSAAEEEAELVDKMKQYRFKANPLNPSIVKMGGLLGVPRKRTNPNLTTPMSPHLSTKKLAVARKGKEGEMEEVPEASFVAQPLPDFSKVKLPVRMKRPATRPESPAIKKRRKLKEEVEPAEEHSHVVKAQPMPNFEKVFAPQYPQRMVTPQPFSFDKRDKNKKVLHKEEKATPFKAQLLPRTTFQPSQLPKVPTSVTNPQPFTLHTEMRGAEHELKWKEKVEEEFEQAKRDQEFKAVEAPGLYDNPFVPKKSTKALTTIENVVLHSDVRSSRRAKFEREKQKRAHALETENLERRALREAEEAKQIAAFRKTLVHKPQPIGCKLLHTNKA